MNTPSPTHQTEPSDVELVALHDAYVASVNYAVAADDLVLADELARAFDEDVRDLNAQRSLLAA